MSNVEKINAFLNHVERELGRIYEQIDAASSTRRPTFADHIVQKRVQEHISREEELAIIVTGNLDVMRKPIKEWLNLMKIHVRKLKSQK